MRSVAGLQTLAAPARWLLQIEESRHSEVICSGFNAAPAIKVSAKMPVSIVVFFIVFPCRVSAGYPVCADNYERRPLDLQESLKLRLP